MWKYREGRRYRNQEINMYLLLQMVNFSVQMKMHTYFTVSLFLNYCLERNKRHYILVKDLIKFLKDASKHIHKPDDIPFIGKFTFSQFVFILN